MAYITFEEYVSLGGKCTEDTFPLLQYDIETLMDFVTENRLSKLVDKLGYVPEEVKMLEVQLVNISSSKSHKEGVSSYSNGIESFSYDTSKSSIDSMKEKVSKKMLQYLYPKYPELFYRGRYVNGRNSDIVE